MVFLREIIKTVVVVLVTLFTACYNRFDAPTPTTQSDVTCNITIEMLHELLGSADYVDITDEITLGGYVTAHDESGNFYKSFMIENMGYAIEILEGISDSYVRHPIGYWVTVSLNGLRITRDLGVLQVGVAAESGSYYDVDYMQHQYIADQHITNTGYFEEVTPREYTLSELLALGELSTSACGRLVKITGLRYYAEDDDDGFWSGTHRFVDQDDPLTDDEPQAELYSYVSSYSNFSQTTIPLTEGSITGILQCDQVKGTNAYYAMVKPRNSDDLNF